MHCRYLSIAIFQPKPQSWTRKKYYFLHLAAMKLFLELRHKTLVFLYFDIQIQFKQEVMLDSC